MGTRRLLASACQWAWCWTRQAPCTSPTPVATRFARSPSAENDHAIKKGAASLRLLFILHLNARAAARAFFAEQVARASAHVHPTVHGEVRAGRVATLFRSQ